MAAEARRSTTPTEADTSGGRKPAKTSGRTGTRLSATDWLDAALDLLVREGVREVKISRLCTDLGVTKGSFYWHFEDIDALMDALIEHWTALQVESFRNLADIEHLPAEQRLETMAHLLVERNWSVEAAIRDWAYHNPRVAKSVSDLDRRIFDVVFEGLTELDFAAEDARLRAGLLVYAGIGFIHGRGGLPSPTKDEIHAIFGLIVDGGKRTTS